MLVGEGYAASKDVHFTSLLRSQYLRLSFLFLLTVLYGLHGILPKRWLSLVEPNNP